MRRLNTRLLKQVGGKPHATGDDHESSDAAATAPPMPTPPDSSRPKRKANVRQAAAITIEDEEPQTVKEQKDEEEDYLREPESSDGEEMANETQSGPGQFVARKTQFSGHGLASEGVAEFKQACRSSTSMARVSPAKKAAFKAPTSTSASINDPSRRELSDRELEESENEDFVETSQRARKRQKTASNIHVVKRSSQNVFGRSQGDKERKQKARELARQKKEKEKSQKVFRGVDANVQDNVPAPVFKSRKLPDFPSSSNVAGATKGEDGSSSPLSSLSASPEPDSMSVVCDTCNERVNKLLKEEYDDEYVKGKSWNIQWQERFCEWHRAQTAKETWNQRGYPNIDWTCLEQRMRQHDAFLLSVLRDKTKSHYRNEYAAKVKAKSMSTGFKDATIRPGAAVGYYGPKGEKAMSEHILSGLSKEIRERAKLDKLVSPSGYQGGISGFVQGVLVPHLAELLIKDDMRLSGKGWDVQSRELIVQSADVGELLHPDVEDRRHTVEEEDDWVLH